MFLNSCDYGIIERAKIIAVFLESLALVSNLIASKARILKPFLVFNAQMVNLICKKR